MPEVPTLSAPEIESVSDEEVWETWRMFSEDRSRTGLRDALVNHYLPLLKEHAEIVHRSRGGSSGLLISGGFVGLVRAINKFDPNRAISFKTFSEKHIRGAMLDDQKRYSKSKKRTISIQGLINDDNRNEVDFLVDKNQPEASKSGDKIDFLQTVMRGLNQEERMILILHYYERQTFEQIAEVLGSYKERVLSTHAEILKYLRERFANRLQLIDAEQVDTEKEGAFLEHLPDHYFDEDNISTENKEDYEMLLRRKLHGLFVDKERELIHEEDTDFSFLELDGDSTRFSLSLDQMAVVIDHLAQLKLSGPPGADEHFLEKYRISPRKVKRWKSLVKNTRQEADQRKAVA